MHSAGTGKGFASHSLLRPVGVLALLNLESWR